MEGGEELSEAQESDSDLREPCKVEESFRLCHGFCVNPPAVSERNTLIFQLHNCKKITFKCKCQYIDL